MLLTRADSSSSKTDAGGLPLGAETPAARTVFDGPPPCSPPLAPLTVPPLPSAPAASTPSVATLPHSCRITWNELHLPPAQSFQGAPRLHAFSPSTRSITSMKQFGFLSPAFNSGRR